VFYNTAAVIDADGSYLGKYRKQHIPQVKGFWEKFFFKPGNGGYPVFKTRYAKVGVYICYDRHFPEGARCLGLNGAEIVFNPSATWPGCRSTSGRSSSPRTRWPTPTSSAPSTASAPRPLEHRQVLRHELLREPARRDHGAGSAKTTTSSWWLTST
jgi:hypothetical protein